MDSDISPDFRIPQVPSREKSTGSTAREKPAERAVPPSVWGTILTDLERVGTYPTLSDTTTAFNPSRFADDVLEKRNQVRDALPLVVAFQHPHPRRGTQMPELLRVT